MPAEELIVVETREAFLVAYASDPDDWIASFKKSATFPARVWAERMVMLYSRPTPAQPMDTSVPAPLSPR